MRQKKILIISRSFYPHISPRSFRTTELVKEFSKMGHDVTILTHKTLEKQDAHNEFEQQYGVKVKSFGKGVLPKLRLGNNKIKNVIIRILSRTINLLFEYPDIELFFLVKKALKKESNYDLLISIAVPHTTHWGVAASDYKKVSKIWIADCGDPYMGSTADSFKKLFYFKYVEKWWCKKANFITVPIQGAVEAYYKEFHNKIKVIPQGFNFEEIKIDKENYLQNKVITFAYSGLLIPGARDPRPFIEYLLTLDIKFKFILYNKQPQLLDKVIKKAKGMVERRDYIKREKLLIELSKMDFLVNFNNGVTTQLPSKLIDYYLTGRPVLSLDSFNLDTRNIDKFIVRDYSASYNFCNVEQYNIKNVCNNFLKLL